MHISVDDLSSLLQDRLATYWDEVRVRRASGYEPELCYGRQRGPATVDARPAAVLILFYPYQQQWYIPLTLRPNYLQDHAGQVSFPGGAREPGETAEQCALREFQEELGVAPETVRIVGRLPASFIYASGFCVEPFVAVAATRPDFDPNPDEVAELLETPVAHLISRDHDGWHEIQRRGLKFRTPHITFQGHRIWGATGIMLGELIEVLQEATDCVE